MLKSQAVAQYLPYLRRYARALTGGQASGDAYVSATLEALIADPKVIDDTGGPRVALYRLFTKIWGSVGINGERPLPDADMAADMRLASLTPLPRQAFLLVALEGFCRGGRGANSGCRCRQDCDPWLKNPGASWRPRSPPTS